MDNELKEKLVSETNGDKAKALAMVIVAEQEAETKKAEIEAETKKTKKERVLGYVKVIGTLLGTALLGGISVFNARSVMKFEETGTIRTKAWTGVKPDKAPEIR